MNFYPHHIGDYISHTAHLTNEEDLAYRRLIELYYQSEKPIPLDIQSVVRSIRLRDFESSVEAVLNEFFDKTEEGYRNKRCDDVISGYHGQIEAGKRGAAIRWAKGNNREPIAPLNAPQTHPIATPIATNNQEPITNNHIKTTPLVNPVGLTPVDKSKNGLNCPHQKLLDLYHTECKSLAKVARWSESRRKAMATLWKTVCNEEKFTEESQGIVYFEGYFNWIEQSDFLCGRTGTGNFIATIDWILKPANFTKIIEGNYHRMAA